MTDSDERDKITPSVARFLNGQNAVRRRTNRQTDQQIDRWIVHGVPVNVQKIATNTAGNQDMTVGYWISEAVVAFSKANANRVSADVPAVDPPPELMDVIKDVQDRLTKLESRDTRGLLGRLFGKGSAAARSSETAALLSGDGSRA